MLLLDSEWSYYKHTTLLAVEILLHCKGKGTWIYIAP